MVGVVEILQSIAGAWPYVFLEFYGNDGKVAGFSGTEKRMKKKSHDLYLGLPKRLCFMFCASSGYTFLFGQACYNRPMSFYLPP